MAIQLIAEERGVIAQRFAAGVSKKAIAAGTMEASVAQFPSEMGRVAVESAVKVIRGGTVPAEVKVKLELVTKDNAK